MNLSNFFGPDIFTQPILVPLVSYLIQNTVATVLILVLIGLVVLQEPIIHLFLKKGNTEDQDFEFRYFWQTLMLIPLVSVPFIWAMYQFGVFEIYTGFESVGLMALQLFVMIVLHDAYFYWCHRLLHTKFFWDIHGIHHRDTDPTVVSSHIFHHIETAINYTFLVWFTLLAGLLVGGVFFLPALVFVLFTITWNVYGHGKKNIFPDNVTKSWLGQWIVWPSYHLEHHRQGTGNFEFFFTYWDKLMKTKVE